jgi:hypothetical protein
MNKSSATYNTSLLLGQREKRLIYVITVRRATYLKTVNDVSELTCIETVCNYQISFTKEVYFIVAPFTYFAGKLKY